MVARKHKRGNEFIGKIRKRREIREVTESGLWRVVRKHKRWNEFIGKTRRRPENLWREGIDRRD